MLIAEIRHKLLNLDLLDPNTPIYRIRDSFHELREDLLTADVFGALKYLPRLLGLAPVLRTIAAGAEPDSPFHSAIPLLLSEVAGARFHFWPTLLTPRSMSGVRTEPDVVIEFPKHVVLVEAKYRCDLGVDQLARELLAGIAAYPGKNVFVLLVTSGTAAPCIPYANKRLRSSDYLAALATNEKLHAADAVTLANNPIHVLWVSWRAIRQALESASAEAMGGAAAEHIARADEMVADLLTLLDMRSIRSFRTHRTCNNGRQNSFLNKRRSCARTGATNRGSIMGNLRVEQQSRTK